MAADQSALDYFDAFEAFMSQQFREEGQPGRPSVEEREFKEFARDMRQIYSLYQAGLLSDFIKSTNLPNEAASNQDGKTSSFGVFRELLGRAIPIEIAEFFGIPIDEGLQDALKKIATVTIPAITVLSSWYLAEEKLQIPTFETKDGKMIYTKLPPVLHTAIALLFNLTKAANAVTKFLEATGGFELFAPDEFTNDKGEIDLIKVLDLLVFGPIGSQFTPF